MSDPYNPAITALIGSILMPAVIVKTPNTKITGAILSVICGVTLFPAWKSGSDALRFLLLAISGVTLGDLLV